MSRVPPIAIVGHGCVLPGALSPAELWRAVVEGRDLLRPVPPGVWRVDTAQALSPQAPERSATDRGGYVQGFDAVFDPSGFACPAEDLAGLDPLVLWLVHCGREALREAGLTVALPERCGLIAGNLSYPTASLSAYAEAVWLDRERPNPANRFSSGLPARLAARALGLDGPAFCLDAACASSLYAVKLACDQLRDGHADLMIAAGVNRGDDLFLHMGFTALNALSPTGRSRPFHREADGLIPAEGAACVVLKRLDDAVRDGNRILGVIRGIGLSNDGRSRGFLVPDAGGQERAIAAAYAQAGLGPEAVSLVECHATGTALGDATEIASMGRVFQGLDGVPIGSLKSNLGHLIAAAGLAGMVKVIQAMAAGVRPPTLHADSAPLDGIAASPFRLLNREEPWEVDGPRRAAISAFGFGGNNAHLILEEWQPATPSVQVAAVPPPSLRVAVVGLAVVTAADDFAAALAAAPPTGDGQRALDSITLDLATARVPPADLRHALPQQLLAMKAVAQAVADAPPLAAATTGVLMGMGCDAEVARRGLGVRLAGLCDPDASVELGPPLNAAGVIGTMPNIVANRFNAQFDWRGPSYSVSAEELSGLAGLRIAARALATGELDAAVVGAVDLSCEPVHRSALAALRPDLATAGDAAVALVLRRVECAEAAGEPIHAILDLSEAGGADGAEFVLAGPQGASPVTRRFGHAHVASGLLHVAAAIVACRGRMQPADGPARPWLGAGPLRTRVTVEALGGAADNLLVESGGIVRPALPPPAIRLRWFAAGSRAELCGRIRRGEDGGQGPVRLSFACPSGREADTLSRALALAEGRAAVADGIHFRERPLGGALAFAFTGAAAAYKGMGRDLLLSMPDIGQAVTQRFPVLAHAAERLYGSAAPLDAMAQLQTCALLCQTHAEVSRGVLGLRPQAMLGLSSGETNALFTAGVWTDMGAMFAEIDASGLYGRHLTGDCLAASQSWGRTGTADWRNWRLLAPVEEVEAALAGLPRVSITIVNAPQDCVIGGDAEFCRQAVARLGTHRALPLGQDMVVHCAELEPCAPVWRRIHRRATTPPEGVALYANAFAQAYPPSIELCAEALTRQAVERVDFPRTVHRAYHDGVRIFVEHGPRNALTRSIAAILSGRDHLAVSLDHPGRAPLEQLAHVAAELFTAGLDPAMAEVARRLERPVAAPPAQPLTFPAPAAPLVGTLGQQMHPAPPLPPVAGLPPPDLAARRPLDAVPEQVASETVSAHVPPADSPIARILARTAELHTGYLTIASDLHRTYLHGFGVSTSQPTTSALSRPGRGRGPTEGGEGEGQGENQGAHGSSDHPSPFPPLRGGPLPSPGTGEGALPPLWTRAQLETLASGKVSEIFGPLFAQQDGYARQVRMPEPPLLLVDRVVSIAGEPGSMGQGSIVTETDVTADAWYLHNGRMPVGIAIESGQADLLLVSWLGADFRNRGERVYRLLGCEMTYHEGGLPTVGDTLRYDIHIDGHARMGEVGLFFFHYDCRIGDRLVLSVRNGQAGFFTDRELANSGGVLWSAEEDRPRDGARLDPLPCPSRHRSFTAEQLDLWTAGRAFACFGAGFELAGSHQRTPAIPQGRMRLIDSVTVFEPQGGPWGRGYLRAESDVPADAWFYAGHFKNDPCMPGTLMAEGAVQAVATFMAAGGFTIGRDSWRFEPVPDEPARFVCRGQVIPDAGHHLVYEVFVEEIEDGPTPIVRAALLCSADGFKVFHCRAFAVRLVPDWPLGQGRHALPARLEAPRIVGTRGDVRGDQEALLACAWGAPSAAFGSMYARFDAGRVPRLPGPPYHFMTSVASVNCPAGEPTVGGTILVDCAVEPDAWYFAENAAPVMPFCVLMEVLLQPCGWLASYMGFALASTEDLAIRNLDGDDARVFAEVTPADACVRTEATLTRFSRAGGITLIAFKVRAWVDDRPLMDLETAFGFFAAAALAKQNGLPPLPDDTARGIPPATPPTEPRRIRLAEGKLRMVDEVTGWWPQGGAAGLGLVRGRQAVDPESWYFKAHFFQDPVQPGSLGVEALLQLLERAMLLAGLDSEMPSPRFEGAALGEPLRWKYRGQVVPTNRTVSTEIEIVRIERDERGILAVARGSLWADDLRIYEVDGLAARLVPSGNGPSGDEPGNLRLDLNRAPWLGDHRPTHTAPAVPLTCLADAMAAAVPGGRIVGLEDVRVQRWVTVPVTLRPETEPDGRVTLRDGGAAVATGRVIREADWPVPPQPFALLDDTHPSPCPYSAGELFHGPAFQILSDLRTGPRGASATLDAAKAARVPGLIGPALLDAGLHAMPRHAPEFWWGDRAAGMLAYPSAIERLSLFGPTPRDGLIRIEVRALPLDGQLDGQGRARSRLQWLAGGRVWAEMELADVLFPKGALGKAPALARQAFLRDRQTAPGVRLSRSEDGITSLNGREVAASNWLPGTLETIYGVSGNPAEMARAIAAKEHAAAHLGVHPGTVTVEAGIARCPAAPLTPVPLSITQEGADWLVGGTASAAPDLAPLQRFWRSHLGTGDWPVEDLFLALAGEFVGQVRVAAPDQLARIGQRGALFLGNHQVAVESLTFALVGAALTGRPILTVAKAEHRDTWLGRLLTLSGSAPELRLPPMMMLFDREDPAAMLGLMEQARTAVTRDGLSIMVHAEGTRSLSCRTPVTRLSGVFLDLAARLEIPIVPVRFAGALPVEPATERLDFPLGFARQDIHIGRPLWPEDLASLPLAERKRRVLDAINGVGPALADEEPNQPRPAFETRAKALATECGLSPPLAAAVQAVLNAIPADRPLGRLARRIAAGEAGDESDPWLSALSRWFRAG
ncbi:beta-ketoacyl synthase [Azospirillum melinis]|uniref:Beta-ketoacyl synthase n=1 Tax=Azospirillum melinis TaxID=328839 RepID=A0ABX2KFT5_9PROT|nr:beta-ketoacyl synthase N-terminal-like domain-containing protein [Azospirillum melinis]NUB01336.1 beta-ketoacyl synthase [Azospirillum melinis]